MSRVWDDLGKHAFTNTVTLFRIRHFFVSDSIFVNIANKEIKGQFNA